MRKIILSCFAAVLLASCGGTRTQTDEQTLYVSILPLRSIVDSIVGGDFKVEVLVPAGASPETFEPTPKQFIGLSKAQLVFNVGLLDFEHMLLSKLERPERIVNLGKGVEVLEGTCSHNHAEGAHQHGVDPHIWTAPRALQVMAENAYKAIMTLYPDSVKYTANYEKLAAQLRELDAQTAAQIAASGVKSFVIYHPALTYYARDYGLEQVAIEADGKEPSARGLGEIIRQARANNVRKILYQSQFPVSVVETVARDIDAQPVEVDPLREDVIVNIREMTETITQP